MMNAELVLNANQCAFLFELKQLMAVRMTVVIFVEIKRLRKMMK